MWDDNSLGVTAVTPADTEYVERVRRRLTRYDRWRPVLLAIYILTMIVFIGLLATLTEALMRLGNMPGLWPGIAAGIVLGCFVGLTAVNLGHGLGYVLVRSRRSDRLLVRYHDALCPRDPKSV